MLQASELQLFLWLFLWLFLLLFLWGIPGLGVTSYSYGYSYGVFPASELPAIPMAIPRVIPMAIP